MGFFTWLIFIIILAFVLFAAASWMLNWFYPELNTTKLNNIEANEVNEVEEVEDEITILQRRKKWIGIFVLVATIVIMTMTGINAFLAQT